MSVKKELWAGLMIKNFRFMGTWVEGIMDESRFVGNNVIHLAELGADPDVLIDNNVYPIPTNNEADNDLPVALKKLETTNESVTEDELYAISFDKIGAVVEKHRLKLEETALQHGLFSIAPASNTANTPVLKSTGANDETGTRKMLTVNDIIRLKRQMDDLKIPKSNRRLVLCNEHVQDLLMTSEVFRNQYKDIATGRILNLFGFSIHEDVYSPMYDPATLARMAFGATPTTQKNASTAFWTPDVFRARGAVKMYYRLAEKDPEYRQTTAGFRLWHIILPKKARSQAAIVSDVNA